MAEADRNSQTYRPKNEETARKPPTEVLDIHLSQQQEEVSAEGIGFEVELGKFWLNPETNKWVHWHERYLVIRSHKLALSAIDSQNKRINQAQLALEKLANKPGTEIDVLGHKVENRWSLSSDRYFNKPKILCQVFMMAIPSAKRIVLLPNKYLRLFVT
ncbi:MAG: hypothetical protein HWQ43_05330 [Nostoc sp. JL31]|uniref:hypothetical protein n=1 Tax=Nostoc sp. JL31 TaxID=2815395 RepID=UPI0025E59057|nr:hypothetical protein [Nostoc sp. JL31]MBN3888604.1 hypothetical protein [Nostoc sp. JL31]